MKFEKLCELREIYSDEGRELGPEEVGELLDEVRHLRIIIQVLEFTLELWRLLKGQGEDPEGILLRQHAAAVQALSQIDGGISEE